MPVDHALRERVRGAANAVRRSVPEPVVPHVARVRGRLSRSRPARLQQARAQMEFLLGPDTPPGELDRLAGAYLDYTAWRNESRQHVELETTMRVHGLEHLTRFSGAGRPVVLSFVHHGPWDGGLASVARHGVVAHVVVTSRMVDPDSPAFYYEILRKGVCTGNQTIDVAGGARAILRALGEGKVVGIAADVKGSSAVRFMGREFRAAFGTAHLAHRSGTPVVVISCRRDDAGRPEVHLSAPLLPSEHADASALHQAIMSEHEVAVRLWPEAYDQPLDRFTRDLEE